MGHSVFDRLIRQALLQVLQPIAWELDELPSNIGMGLRSTSCPTLPSVTLISILLRRGSLR